MSYQSFPWEDGDSKSLAKLKALRLPNLAGKSVLDVGCNSGFFCGFAHWQGANRVVGVDRYPEYIKTARNLFPECHFLCEDWMSLDDEQYDVILFLSAIHYAPDQQVVLDYLMEKLKPGGVLVLEIGVAPGDDERFVEVKRAIDSRFFPTRKKLSSMLSNYVVKSIGLSVSQEGDPVPRSIYHISRKLPVAALLMDTPHSGKSAIALALFKPELKLISGDAIYLEILRGQCEAPVEIARVVRDWSNGSELNCAAITYHLCKLAMLPQLCELILAKVKDADFVLDMYVTPPCREAMRDWWASKGFFVADVTLRNAKARREDAGDLKDCDRYMEFLSHDFLINETDYLAANPAVAKAVAEGKMPSAQYHYWHFGRRENRPLKP